MPSASERQRNNIKTGLFVSVTIIIAIVVIALLTNVKDALFARTENYSVTFPVRSGVANLKTGSEVRVGGVRMGDVVRVEPPVRDPFDEIRVTFRIDRRVSLRDDAIIYIASPLIGAESWLAIAYVGRDGSEIPAGGELAGMPGLGMLTALLGADYAGRAAGMIDDAEQFSSMLARIPADYDERILPALTDVQALVSRIRHDDWPAWAASVHHVMSWAAAATDDLDKILAEGDRVLTTVGDVVDENRPNILATSDNLAVATGDARDVIARLQSETIDKLHALFDRGTAALDEAHVALNTIRRDYDGWVPHIEESLANAAMAAQQLKLASIEVRRSPWKLLYQPSRKELEHELLYEAARSFAMAASDLKAASIAAQRVLHAHGDRLAVDEEVAERIRRSLLDPLEGYEKAQQRLLDILFVDPVR